MAHAQHYATVKQLFREHNRSLVNFLLARLPAQQDALDVAQECYVRLLQLDRPGTVGFLRGYLFRIAANLAVDRVRRIQVRERESNLELFDEWSDPNTLDAQAITDQEVSSVAEALQSLPRNCREAFVLHIVEGYGTAEIAARMKVRDRQVRRYVARAQIAVGGKSEPAPIATTIATHPWQNGACSSSIRLWERLSKPSTHKHRIRFSSTILE